MHLLQVESILNPVRGIRDAQARAGITPTDHSRHNILAIKEQSRLNALQKQQQEEQAQQHLRPQMRRTTSGSAGGAGPGGINRTLSGGGRAAAAGAGRPVIVRSVSGNAAAGGRSASGGGSSDGRDFVQENKAAAAAASRPVKAESRQDSGAAYLQKSEYGQVPGYLLQRKVEMAQQEAAMQAAKQAAQIPAGARLRATNNSAAAATALTAFTPAPARCLRFVSMSLHRTLVGCVCTSAPSALACTQLLPGHIPASCTNLTYTSFTAHISASAGLRQMPEAERLATLQLLDANKAEVEARLSALPIIIETPSAVRHAAKHAGGAYRRQRYNVPWHCPQQCLLLTALNDTERHCNNQAAFFSAHMHADGLLDQCPCACHVATAAPHVCRSGTRMSWSADCGRLRMLAGFSAAQMCWCTLGSSSSRAVYGER